MSDDEKTYGEGLRTDIDNILTDLAEMNDEPIVEGDFHRNSLVAIQTALSAFQRAESEMETAEMADRRADVAAHATSLIDGQMMLSGADIASLPDDVAKEEIDPEMLDAHVRLPRTLALTTFLATVQAFLKTPDDSGLETEYALAVADCERNWPDIADELHSDLEARYSDALSDITDDTADDRFTDIDIEDIGGTDE